MAGAAPDGHALGSIFGSKIGSKSNAQRDPKSDPKGAQKGDKMMPTCNKMMFRNSFGEDPQVVYKI